MAIIIRDNVHIVPSKNRQLNYMTIEEVHQRASTGGKEAQLELGYRLSQFQIDVWDECGSGLPNWFRDLLPMPI